MHIAERHASDVKGMLQSMAHDFRQTEGWSYTERRLQLEMGEEGVASIKKEKITRQVAMIQPICI